MRDEKTCPSLIWRREKREGRRGVGMRAWRRRASARRERARRARLKRRRASSSRVGRGGVEGEEEETVEAKATAKPGGEGAAAAPSWARDSAGHFAPRPR